jgi:hypothetical protein
VSSFVSLNSSPSLTVFGVLDISFQWLAHSFEFPHRLACFHFGQCPNETYTEDGISMWVVNFLQLSRWLLALDGRSVLRNLSLGVLVLIFIVANVLEYIMVHITLLGALLLFVSTIGTIAIYCNRMDDHLGPVLQYSSESGKRPASCLGIMLSSLRKHRSRRSSWR